MSDYQFKFRASESSQLMVEPKSKGKAEKYADTILQIHNLTEKCKAMNPETKTYKNTVEKINELSELAKVLYEFRNDKTFSETAKKLFIKVYLREKYKRVRLIDSKFMTKGTVVEDDSITLLSLETKTFFEKNEERLTDDVKTGLPDLSDSKDIRKAKIISDIKSSWDADTFLLTKYNDDDINPDYYWQGQCYLDLTGAKIFDLCYCLVNTPSELLQKEIWRLRNKHNIIDIESDAFIEEAKQVEINHIFDLDLFIKHNPSYQFYNNINEWCYDMPRSSRLFIQRIERNDDDINRMNDKMHEGIFWIRKNLTGL